MKQEEINKKFYPDIDANDICLTPCIVKNNGVMIGSIRCQGCLHHKDNNKGKGKYDSELTWLICDVIKEAVCEQTSNTINKLNNQPHAKP